MASESARTRLEVSVIVPARNEELSLPDCLDSLVSQQGIAFEVIVVNDGSTDRTREIALSYPRVQIVDSGPLPPAWTGKNNALVTGARIAQGEWLLFTDADTVHLPGSLANSVNQARQRSVALLSYSPQQEVHGLLQHAVMPVIFAELAVTYRPREVCNPASPVAAANGQYLLISRDVYDAFGGHEAVAANILEDVALAKAVKNSGRNIVLLYGQGVVRTRMYRNFAQLREGWTKNLAVLFPSASRLATLRIAEFVLVLGGMAITIAAAIKGSDTVSGIAAAVTLIAFGVFLKRIKRAHFPWQSNLLAFFGLLLFAYLLLRSRLFYKRGKIEWKGRAYAPSSESARSSAIESGPNPGHPAAQEPGNRALGVNRLPDLMVEPRSQIRAAERRENGAHGVSRG